MTEKRRNIIIIAAVSVVFLALLIVATFYDLEITRALADLEVGQYQSNNIFGRIFATIGEMPVYLITLFAASIIIAIYNADGSLSDTKIVNFKNLLSGRRGELVAEITGNYQALKVKAFAFSSMSNLSPLTEATEN